MILTSIDMPSRQHCSGIVSPPVIWKEIRGLDLRNTVYAVKKKKEQDHKSGFSVTNNISSTGNNSLPQKPWVIEFWRNY
jgi:3,4-dihydroxy-2-butanone 4-phosphate synthase